jgi:N-acetylneuraminic acid mutarotase
MSRPPARRLALMLSLFVLASCGENTAPNPSAGTPVAVAPSFALASNTWMKRARVPHGPTGPRNWLAAGVANNTAGRGILYIFGGSSDNNWLDEVQAYDPLTNTWSLRGRFPAAQRSATNGVGNIGGKLYISGGYVTGSGFGGQQKTLYAYDPATNRMNRKADMPRTGADGVTGVINGKLYVLASTCGYDCSDRFIRRLYRYDPPTNAWTGLVWCPRFHINGAGGVINGKFYVAGGIAPFIGPTANLDVYDPVTNKWKALAPMPDARVHAAGVVVGGLLYVVGGLGTDAYDQVGNTTQMTTAATAPCIGSCGRRTLFAYNPVTNTWSTKASMPTPRFGLAAAPLPFDGQSHFIAVGGTRQLGDSAASANELYTP